MNTQITEDYVSFEIAKLLKEKGFDESTCGFYHDDYMGKLLVSNPSNHNGSINSIAAPSQAHAMKWLREEKNIFIDIYYDEDVKGYLYSIIKLVKGTILNVSDLAYNTYEETCEAAIKYCLTNLI